MAAPVNPLDDLSLAPINPAVQAKIDELRAELKPDTDVYAAANGGAASPIMTDQSLIRYLKGEGYDLAVVAKRMRFTLKWREEVGADAIRAGHVAKGTSSTRQIPGWELITRTALLGSTSLGITNALDGDAIVIRFPGRIDPAVVKAEVPFEELTDYCTSYVEWVAHTLETLSLAAGRIVRYHVVYDMSGLGMRHLSKDFVFIMKSQTKLFQIHYAELLSSINVINAPAVFAGVFALVKPMMSAETLRKLSILGGHRPTWRARLVEMFPPEAVPQLLGGTMPNSDLSMPAGFDFELAGSDHAMSEQLVAVAARDAADVALVVPARHTAAWKFSLVRGADITLRATRGDDGSAVGEWLRTAKAGDGVWTNAGDAEVTLTLAFDNSYSWVTSKEVKLWTDVEDSAAAAAAALAAEEGGAAAAAEGGAAASKE